MINPESATIERISGFHLTRSLQSNYYLSDKDKRGPRVSFLMFVNISSVWHITTSLFPLAGTNSRAWAVTA